MVDISSIVAGLQAVEHGLGIVKTIRNADFKLEKSELKLQMADLMDTLANAKIGLTNSREQIAKLEEEISRLRAFQKRRIRHISGMYLEISEDGKVIDGAFCSRCHDVDERFVRILHDRKGERGAGICPQCKTDYALYKVESELSNL